jgi:chloramphenicol 3-O phosphotransferase
MITRDGSATPVTQPGRVSCRSEFGPAPHKCGTGILDQVVQIIVLNGGSSSGKTGIARCLQTVLPEGWIGLSVDDLVNALPLSLVDSDSGISFGQHGEVAVRGGFREVEAAWMVGVPAMARAGARIIFDDVFLGGAASQERTRAHLQGLEVLWVGVRCDPVVAAGREVARGDRARGMAVSQAELVHKDAVYDIEVDTSHAESLDCARLIAAHVSLAACLGRTVDTLMS